MDSLSSPRLGRRPRYESFPHPPHFPDHNYSPERHPPFPSFAPHTAAPAPHSIPRNQFYEPWLVHSHGDLPYFPSSHRPNPSSLDLRYLPSSPRVPHGKHLVPEDLGKADRFQPNGGLFELGHMDGALVARRRMGAEQDRFSWEDSEWKGRRTVRVSDERESRYRDTFVEQIPPGAAAALEAAAPPFVSPRHRHPPTTSPRFFGRPFSDPKVVKSTGAVPNSQSQAVGNGSGFQRAQTKYKKKNNGRAVPTERGYGGRQFSGLKSMKKSDPVTDIKEDGFRSSYHSNMLSMDKKHEFKEDCYTGKRKMASSRVVKYNEESVKRPMQKPSAFSRIQSGLSVWERLEEKPLILSPPCSLPSPRISADAKAKASIIEPTSFESNTLAPKALDPFIAELSPIEKNLFIEKPTRVLKKKNMIQIREKLIIPSVSSLAGSSRTNKLVMKKKKKNVIHTREKVVIPIVPCSPGSIAKQGVNRNSNANSLGSVSVLPQPNKADVSCRMPESKLLVNARIKKVKKLAANKMSGAEEATKMSSRVDGCIIKAPKMEDVMEIPEHEGAINCAKKTSYCTPNGDTGTEPINGSHLQIYQKNLTKLGTPTDNISANIITTDVNQAQDIVAEILTDRGEESLKLGEKLDSIGQGSFNFDASVCSQSSEYIIDNLAANDAFMNMEENVASNSIKQIKSPKSPFSRKIKQDMPPPDTAVSPELLGAREVFVSNALKCSSAQMEIEKEVKHQEKTVFITATKELEVPGDFASSESCIHAPQAPSFSEISNSAPEQKLHGKGTAKEDNMIPQSVCDMNFPDGLGTFTIDFRGKKIGRALEPMEMGSPSTHFENVSQSHPLLSESMDFNEHGGNGNPELGSKGEAFVSSMVSNSLELEHESVKTSGNNQLMPEKAQLSPSPKHRKQVSPNPKLTDEEIFRIKRSPLSGVRRSLPHRPNFSASPKETARPNQTGRHRTWRRASTSTPSLQSDENPKLGGISSKQVPKKPGRIQNSSYFRKGNSLIRKLAAERSPLLPPTVDSSCRKFKYSTEGGRRVFRFGYPNSVAPSHTAFERSKTPPLPPLSKMSGFTMNSHSDLPQLVPMDRSPEPVTDQGNQHDIPSTNLGVCNSETNQDTASCKTVEIANGKRVIYVKRNLNQLVAAPRTEIGDSCKILTEKFQKPVHHPIKKSKKTPFSSSYLYYRSKRNQLIRNVTSDSNLAGIPEDNTNSVLQKAKKPSRSSLVWTLGGDKLSQKCITTSLCQSVFPYIFPWKRTANWKRFITANSTPISSRSSVSLISRKLQCLTKRNTIYKISTNGFSLRKAGVVGIGGSSLKWSKSIEKRSKKASEEATLAVAEVERKLRERKRSKSACGNGKNKVSSSCRSISGIELKRGERIFRVGSARYKMDASMRTLLRIPDDHSSSPGNQQQGNRSRISFVPKRLIIGNNEYVQIGNGDQLVRDPKKLKRILANDKVRWSLHSARLRSAQKRQYCLFFTRFGKCNKSGRKCPYIHDPTKVAICTKFLKGHCSDTKCKLTHKVIPERMPDCSYFLRGLCTNINCPYRHVKVNVNAPLCDGFLRGHCADGDECRKKHSYTCPLFEATGKCPQGSLCKLHHPKIQTKSKKRKRIEIQSNSQGRYFYSGESLGVPSSQNDLAGGNSIFRSDGQLTEYNNLDGDNFAIQNDESYTGKLDFGYLDFQSCDIDELIKPVRIMHNDDLPIF